MKAIWREVPGARSIGAKRATKPVRVSPAQEVIKSEARTRVAPPAEMLPACSEKDTGETLCNRKIGLAVAAAPVVFRKVTRMTARRSGPCVPELTASAFASASPLRIAPSGGRVRSGTTNVSSSTSIPSASFHVCTMGARAETVCCRTQRVPPSRSGWRTMPKLRTPPPPKSSSNCPSRPTSILSGSSGKQIALCHQGSE